MNRNKNTTLPVWLTSKGSVVQHDLPNKVVTTTNQLLYSNSVVYLIPRGTVTDNYSIPLGINKSKYDVRPSHLHDIGCYYHKVLVVDLPLYKIDKYIDYKDGIKLIQKEFNLLPLNRFNYKSYGTFGWQVTIGTEEEKEQARFVSSFMDIYENSFN